MHITTQTSTYAHKYLPCGFGYPPVGQPSGVTSSKLNRVYSCLSIEKKREGNKKMMGVGKVMKFNRIRTEKMSKVVTYSCLFITYIYTLTCTYKLIHIVTYTYTLTYIHTPTHSHAQGINW